VHLISINSQSSFPSFYTFLVSALPSVFKCLTSNALTSSVWFNLIMDVSYMYIERFGLDVFLASGIANIWIVFNCLWFKKPQWYLFMFIEAKVKIQPGFPKRAHHPLIYSWSTATLASKKAGRSWTACEATSWIMADSFFKPDLNSSRSFL